MSYNREQILILAKNARNHEWVQFIDHWPADRTLYSDITMGAMASQITSLTIVCSTVYSSADQSKHKNSASPAFVREFTGDRWIPHTYVQ